jgi:hypothetical protein
LALSTPPLKTDENNNAKMFSAHFKTKYELSYAYQEEDHDQDKDLLEAQQAFLRHLVDQTEAPSELELKVYGTKIKIATLRDAVR